MGNLRLLCIIYAEHYKNIKEEHNKKAHRTTKNIFNLLASEKKTSGNLAALIFLNATHAIVHI